jgi:hypothetical protein
MTSRSPLLPVLLPALLPALLLGCYAPSSVQDTAAGAEADPSGGTIWGDDSSSGGSSGAGTASDRGILTDEDFTVFWRWYGNADWEEGTCTEILLRNDGDEVRTWQLALELSAEIGSFSHEDGAFFIVDGTTLLADPVTNTRISAGSSASMSYCAEPRASVLSADVRATRGGGTDDDDDAGSDDEDDGSDDTDTDDSLVLGDVETPLEGVRLYYREGTESQGGRCMELNLTNEGSTSWTIEETTLRFSEPVTLTDYWESLFRVDEETLAVSWPSYLGDLDPGETFRGTACLDPLSEPVSVDVVGYAAIGD